MGSRPWNTLLGRRRAILLAGLVLGACRPDPGATAPPRAPTDTAEADAPAKSEKKLSIKEKVAARIAAREQADREAATVELALEQLKTRHIVVPVAVGEGEPMAFIVDTGASMTVITPGTRDALGIGAEDGMAVQAQGAGGSVGTPTRVIDLAGVRLGDRIYAKVSAAVMDLAHLQEKLDREVAGILGRNFLKRHDLEIDFVEGKIRFHGMGSRAREHADTLAEMDRIPFEEFAQGGLIKITAVLDAKNEVQGVFDLGAGRTVINWKAANAAGVTPRSKGVRHKTEAALGADNKPVKTAARTFDGLALGDASFTKPELHIADLPVFETLAVADGPAIIFGVDLLSQRRLVVDYDNKALYLSR